MRPPRLGAQQQRDNIPMEPSTIQKKKERAEAIKAARAKYSNLSRAALPPPTTTVPIDRPLASSFTSRLRPPSASALPPPGAVFRPDPAAAAAIRAGPQPASAVTGRGTAVPRPSLAQLRPSIAPRPSAAPRPSLMARPLAAPRPSMLPRDPDAPLAGFPSASTSHGPGPSSSSVPFESMGDSLSRILRNEPLPMAPGARASSIARRNIARPSMVPGGINIFTATGADLLEAERLQGVPTPGRLRLVRGDESVHRSRVRFEVVESIQEQRESVGDEEDTTSSSAATSSLSTLTLQSSVQRAPSSLGPLLDPIQPVFARPPQPPSIDPPRSILKQRKSPRGAVSSSSTSVVVATSSTSILVPATVETTDAAAAAAVGDENRPTRETPSRARATPRKESEKRKKKNQGMMDVFAILNRMSDEEKRETPPEMIKACMELLRKMEQEKREESRTEEDTEEEEEESVLDRGIVVVEEEEAEEEEEVVEVEQSMALPPIDQSFTPRRRSSRLASSQGKVARSLFSS